MDFLERLRTKPSHVKAQIAFTSALSVTLLIGIVWASTLGARFDTLSVGSGELQDSPVAVEEQSPNSLMDVFRTTTEQLGTLIEGVPEEKSPQAPSAYDALQDFAPSQGEGILTEEQGSIQLSAEPSTEPEPVPPPAEPVVNTIAPQAEEAEVQAEETPPQPEPRVILIGTTTSQKTE